MVGGLYFGASALRRILWVNQAGHGTCCFILMGEVWNDALLLPGTTAVATAKDMEVRALRDNTIFRGAAKQRLLVRDASNLDWHSLIGRKKKQRSPARCCGMHTKKQVRTRAQAECSVVGWAARQMPMRRTRVLARKHTRRND